MLDGYTAAERENLLQAIDTTAIYDPATRRLIGLANNYWAVLARCELRRQQLGVLPDTSCAGHRADRVG